MRSLVSLGVSVLALLPFVLVPTSDPSGVAVASFVTSGSNLLVNGGFENPTFQGGLLISLNGEVPGWSDDTGCGVEVQKTNSIGSWSASEGSQYLEVMSNCNPNVYQDVSTVKGAKYTFSFDYALRPNIAQNRVDVYFGEKLLDSLDGVGGNSFQGWTTKNYVVTAEDATTRIRFEGRNDFAYKSLGGFVDNVSVIQESGGSANGDPQFTGFLGQDFQVHGSSDTVYNIISTPSFVYNALFRYLDSGRCRKGTPCFSHPGNYFGSVGIAIRVESESESSSVELFQVQSGSVTDGLTVFDVTRNATLAVSSEVHQVGSYSIKLPNRFEVLVESDEFSLRIQNSDFFLNQDVSIGTALLKQIQEYKRAVKSDEEASVALAQQLPHGILGQTWSSKTYANRWKHIEGQLFDYIVEDGINGNQFKYNKF